MKKVSNLSRYRKEKGFSQTELAKKMNVTQQCVSSWQTGRTIPKPVDYTLKCKELVIALYISKYFLYGGTQWNFFNGLLKR